MSAGPIRVLIAEDDVAVRAVLVDLIEEAGMELVAAVGDTQSAVAVAGTERPDVAILDVRMPGSGGVAAATEIRHRSPATRVIGMSGESDSRTAMLEAGAVAYLLKGSPIAVIVETVEHAAAQAAPGA